MIFFPEGTEQQTGALMAKGKIVFTSASAGAFEVIFKNSFNEVETSIPNIVMAISTSSVPPLSRAAITPFIGAGVNPSVFFSSDTGAGGVTVTLTTGLAGKVTGAITFNNTPVGATTTVTFLAF
jgi:hypothetical protein